MCSVLDAAPQDMTATLLREQPARPPRHPPPSLPAAGSSAAEPRSGSAPAPHQHSCFRSCQQQLETT